MIKFIDAISTFLILLSVGFCAAVFTLFILHSMYEGSVYTMYYETVEKIHSEDVIVNLVADVCDQGRSNVEKSSCVVRFYRQYYNSSENHFGIKPASQFIEEGGLCRDFSVNVCATLEVMNVSCGYAFAPGHVYPVWGWPGVRCYYEMGVGYCNVSA